MRCLSGLEWTALTTILLFLAEARLPSTELQHTRSINRSSSITSKSIYSSLSSPKPTFTSFCFGMLVTNRPVSSLRNTVLSFVDSSCSHGACHLVLPIPTRSSLCASMLGVMEKSDQTQWSSWKVTRRRIQSEMDLLGRLKSILGEYRQASYKPKPCGIGRKEDAT